MPGTKAANHLAARLRAQRQHVFVSGFQGSYTLETGVAYHYRGHYVYATPAGNPIEPIPYSTRKGISIVGIALDQAPPYDPQAVELVPEASVSALERARVREQEAQKEREDAKKEEIAQALEDEARDAEGDMGSGKVAHYRTVNTMDALTDHPVSQTRPSAALPSRSLPASRVGSHTSLTHLAVADPRPTASSTNIPHISNVQPSSMLSVSAYGPHSLLDPHSYTPHDRAQYLATSAPGSRHVSLTNTPHGSRPVSPTQHDVHPRSSLRPIASTSRLSRLIPEEGVQRAFSPLHDVSQDKINFDNTKAFGQTMSRSRSDLEFHSMFRSQSLKPGRMKQDTGSSLYLPGLGHRETERSLSRSRSALTLVEKTRKTSPLHEQGHLHPPHNHEDVRNRGHEKSQVHVESLQHQPSIYSPTDARPQEHTKTGLFDHEAALTPSIRRRAASLLLNSNYNATHPSAHSLPHIDFLAASPKLNPRVPKCPLHSEDCDGVTVTNKHVTEQARERRGFVEEYPMIRVTGRTMIDWQLVMDEERGRVSR